jgi:hypothetical protein
MSTYDNHNNNLETLRERRPEILSVQRLAVVKNAVENLRPHVRVVAESAPLTPAEQFDRQVISNLQPAASEKTMSPEIQASVTDLNEYRSRQDVEAALAGQTYPLPEDFESYAEKIA